MDQPIDLPIADMVIGDSFFVPCIDDNEVKKEASKLAKQYAVDLRVEKVVYNGMYGVRIWRI
jgi:hypothetical protein